MSFVDAGGLREGATTVMILAAVIGLSWRSPLRRVLWRYVIRPPLAPLIMEWAQHAEQHEQMCRLLPLINEQLATNGGDTLRGGVDEVRRGMVSLQADIARIDARLVRGDEHFERDERWQRQHEGDHRTQEALVRGNVTEHRELYARLADLERGRPGAETGGAT